MPAKCLVSFTGCTARRISKEQAWGWPPSNESFTSMADAFGLKRRSIRALPFFSALHPRVMEGQMAILTTEGKMVVTANHEEVEILLVEDDPLDLEMTLRAVQCDSSRNGIEVARGGEED